MMFNARYYKLISVLEGTTLSGLQKTAYMKRLWLVSTLTAT